MSENIKIKNLATKEEIIWSTHDIIKSKAYTFLSGVAAPYNEMSQLQITKRLILWTAYNQVLLPASDMTANQADGSLEFHGLEPIPKTDLA